MTAARHRFNFPTALCFIAVLYPLSTFALSQDTRVFDSKKSPGNRWLLVVCGLPGDDEHREKLTDATLTLATSALTTIGVQEQRLLLLAGDEKMQQELSSAVPEAGVASADALAEACQRLSKRLDSKDQLWVIALGHANLSGRKSNFNLLGPDINQTDFAELVKPIQCRQKVIMLTFPASAFWLRPLADENTVLISATGAALEMTGTEMPYAMAEVLGGTAQHQHLEDIDGDGSLSLLDLYFAANIEVTARFAVIDRLQTENALLEDDGDGRGRELQNDFLPADPLDPSKRGRRRITRASIRDGKLAKQILVASPPKTQTRRDQ